LNQKSTHCETLNLFRIPHTISSLLKANADGTLYY
jgi:hypothetical protein